MKTPIERHQERDHDVPGFDPDCGDCQALEDLAGDGPGDTLPAYTGILDDFRQECEDNQIEVEHYEGRCYYKGPAVRTNENDWPTLQDVIRATSMKLVWDNMGRDDYIVYPK